MILKLSLLLGLFLAVGVGLWDMWQDPTPENAAEALRPTPEKIDRGRRVVQPVVELVASQDRESIKQLIKDGDADLRHRIETFPVRAIVPQGLHQAVHGAPPLQPARRASNAQESASAALGSAQAPAHGPPGIEWYRRAPATPAPAAPPGN